MDLQSQNTRADHPNNANDADRSVSAPGPTPLGTLSVLPYELRCMMYKPLFLDDSTAMTRVSKTFAADTNESFKKHFKFHTTIQWDRDKETFVSDLASRPIPADLDYLEIHIEVCRTLRMYGGERDLRDLLRQVRDRAKPHMKCHVSIEIYGIKRVWNLRWVYALDPLRTFKAVTIAIESGVIRNRNVALELQRMYHVEGRDYHKIVAFIQNWLGPRFTQGRTLEIVGHLIWHIASDGWVKALKDREEDERIDHRYPRLGVEFPGGIAYRHCWASDLVVVPVGNGGQEILRADNGRHNGISRSWSPGLGD